MRRLYGKDEAKRFCDDHNISYTERALADGGTELQLEECAFNSNHKNGDAKLLIRPSGTVAYKCHHNSCKGKKLPDFIKAYEPDFYKDSNINKHKTDEPAVFVPPRTAYDIQSKDPEWVIDGYVPRGAITLIIADGGMGKTTIECSLAAAVSSGSRPFLCGDLPKKFKSFDQYKDPCNVLFLSGEDFTEYTLKEKLQLMGADLERIFVVDQSDKSFGNYKVDSEYLKQALEVTKAQLIIMDPLQSFIREDVNMSARNQMRAALTPLAELLSNTQTACLIAVHSNKRETASGRNRMSDSSDIWDIARSALMVGFTQEEGVRYVSHDKSNWGRLMQTALFRITDKGTIDFVGYSDKRDGDYQQEKQKANTQKREAPTLDSAKAFIEDLLSDADNKTVSAADLKKAAKDNGYSDQTYRRAREELQRDGKIKKVPKGRDGQGKGTEVYWSLVHENGLPVTALNSEPVT